ncbi:COP9 signalosome complex subunit 8 isoform X3 [Ornithorhynchus anatinus]|uniref:COP9 signalosome subunit 8 n=1 Tax=Ornithorhynchus anatinus TaxID=9258 RepID=A0A6I8MYZ4_ORNAN|nr:COP9 signalosome complex subunit 8 isoform X3 [Ornithorhynchus anatinus]
MPVAVMAESAFSFKKLLEQCENQELEAPGGIATPAVYSQLLALYLLHNDMNNARYLWKRIPPAIKSGQNQVSSDSVCISARMKQDPMSEKELYVHILSQDANSELGGIWSVGQRIWQRDFPGIYTTISAHQWSEPIQPIMEALRGVLDQGWQADSTTRMVMPQKPGALDVSFNRFIPLSEPAPVPPIPNEQQLARLTDYVAFLEN